MEIGWQISWDLIGWLKNEYYQFDENFAIVNLYREIQSLCAKSRIH